MSARSHQASPRSACAAASEGLARSFWAAPFRLEGLPLARWGRPLSQSPLRRQWYLPTTRLASASSGDFSRVVPACLKRSYSFCSASTSLLLSRTRLALAASLERAAALSATFKAL